MKSLLVVILYVFLVFSDMYSQKIGGFANDYASKIIQIKNGDLIICSTTKNNSTEGSDDILILKIDSKNFSVETKIIGNKYHDRAYGLCETSNGNILVSGESWGGFSKYGRENAFLLNLKPNLKGNWSTDYYFDARDAGLCCKETKNGDIIIVGYSRSFQITPETIGDILIIRTNNKGDSLWHKTYNSVGNDYGFDFLEKDNGNLIILAESSGFFNSNQADYRFAHDTDILLLETDENGNEINRKYWGGEGHDFAKKIIKSPIDNGYYIIGSTQSFGSGSFDILLLKLDENLDEIWHCTFGDEEVDYGNSFDISNSDSIIYIAATTTNKVTKKPQSTILYADLEGHKILQKDVSINLYTFSSDVVATNDNCCVLVGNAGKYFDDFDIFILKFDKNGDFSNINILNKNIYVFPNPVAKGNILNFEISPRIGKEVIDYNFYIYNINGQTIFQKRSGDFNFEINSSQFEKGIYIYQVIFEGDYKFTGKFIVD